MSSRTPNSSSRKKSPSARKPAKPKTPLQNCEIQLDWLMKKHGIGIFCEPVDPVLHQVPDYFQKVRTPMDLGTVKRRLKKKHYTDADEFSTDVEQVWTNAFLYHAPGTFVHNTATKFRDMFRARFSKGVVIFNFCNNYRWFLFWCCRALRWMARSPSGVCNSFKSE